MVQNLLPAGKRCGILTISKATLTPAHLEAAGVAPDTPIAGTDGLRAFTRDILGDAAEIDFEACRLDMIDAARAMVADIPGSGRHRAGMYKYGALRPRCEGRPPGCRCSRSIPSSTGFRRVCCPKDFRWNWMIRGFDGSNHLVENY